MLFQLAANTPRFQVFILLNAEFLHFLNKAVNANVFSRGLFTTGAVGTACWDNARVNDIRAKGDLTRDKFEKLFLDLQKSNQGIKRQLFETMRDHQNLQLFFNNPTRDLLDFLPQPAFDKLKSVATHLYCATKDLGPIINAAGCNITEHFNVFRQQQINGNVCKACGMEKLAAFRASIPDGDQWRADYDHQLCKSKYPLFAVHPDNLIPLCAVCNQDAKKVKDLFKLANGNNCFAFYPYSEEANNYIDIVIGELRDPEPTIKVNWNTHDALILNKLNTWDEVYEIRSRVEGQFRSLEAIIEDEINPTDSALLVEKIADKARPITNDTLKRKEWAFWHQKLFSSLEKIDIEPFFAKWGFVNQQATDGGDYILES